jgi:hypothetical protein
VSWKGPGVKKAFSAWKELVDHGWFNRDWAQIDWDGAGLDGFVDFMKSPASLPATLDRLEALRRGW